MSPRFLIQEFPVFLLTPRHGLLHHAPVQSGSLAPSWAVWLQSYFGDMPHAPAFRWLRSYRAKCNAEIQIISRKSRDDIPVRVRPAIVRIQNPEASIRAIVQIAQRKPQRKTARLALQVRYLFIRGKPLCQAVACHSPLVPFGETPETIPKPAADQPPSALRIQRPAAAP